MVDTIWFMATVASTGRDRSVSRVGEFKSGNASFRKWHRIYDAMMSDKV